MASSDWPDYTHGVVLSGGSVTDCPDWQEQVVAPGGGSIGSGIVNIVDYIAGSPIAFAAAGSPHTLLSAGFGTLPESTVSVKKWMSFNLVVAVILTTTGVAATDGVLIQIGTPSGLTVGSAWQWAPGVVVTGAILTATLSGEMYTYDGGYYVQATGVGTGTGTCQIGNGGGLSIFGTWPN